MKPFPISPNFVRSKGAFLSSTILAVHCSQCNSSARSEGYVDYLQPLNRHGGHLGCVVLDLFLSNPGTDALSEVRICLMPVPIQTFMMLFSIN